MMDGTEVVTWSPAALESIELETRAAARELSIPLRTA